MIKNILVSLLCAVSIMAYGQSISKYEYWVDYDAENKTTGTGSGGNINVSLDVSELNNGMHFLCFRAMDDKGLWSSPSTTLFLKAENIVPYNSISKYEYWIDYNQSDKTSVASSSEVVTLNIDVNSLNDGMHFLNFQVQDARGQWSAPQTTFFLKTKAEDKANALTQYEYWTDYDVNSKQRVVSNNGIVNLDIDVNALNDGMHFLCFHAQDAHGQWSAPQTVFFMKASDAAKANSLEKYEYWLDYDIANKQSGNIGNGIVSLDIDVNALNDGMHFLCFRSSDSRGMWSAPQTTFFVKSPKFQNDNVIIGYQYWINDATDEMQYVSVDPQSPLALEAGLPLNSRIQKVTPENMTMVETAEGKHKLAVKNLLHLRFKDATKRYSEVLTDTFATVIDAANIDLTAFIVNPDASLGITGWTTTGAVTVNTGNDNPCFCLGNQSNDGWTAQMKQTISGLPAGNYILTAKGRASEKVKLELFAGDFPTEFEGKEWKTEAVSFTTDGNPFDIVINAEATGKDQWAEIDELCLTMGSQSSLTVRMPELANMDNFKNQKLVVSSSQNTQALTTTQAKEYSFRGLSANGVYRISLLTKYGEEIAALDNVSIDEGENTVTLPELKPIRNVRLNVTDGEGAALASKVAINWQDKHGKYLANGNEIGGMVEGSKLAYTVTLSDSLGTVYAEPDRTKYTVKGDENNVQVVLQRLVPVTLQGTVRGSTMPLSGARVSAVQWINGRYIKTVSTRTGAQGGFSLPLYNDSTKLTVSCDGYLDKVLSFAKMDGGTDLGNITMEEIVGTTLHLDISYQKSVSEGEDAEVQSWYTDMNNVELAIRNATADSLVTGFNVQNYSIVTYRPLNVGDRLEITVKSRNNDFADVVVDAVVSDSTVVTMPLVEKGGIAASYASSTNNECIGILYDANGVQVARTAYTAGSLSFRQLENGDYTLVSMGNSRLLGNVMNLSDLSAIGLNEGEHYIVNNVSVDDGIICNVEVEEIPEIDEMLFYYTGPGTMFAVNKSCVTVGQYITLTTKIDFKEEYQDGVRNISLVFDLPEGCEYVNGSAIIGTALASCSIEGNKVTIALPDDGYTDRIRFCITPTQSGNYIPSAFVQFSNDGNEVMQPLGNVAFTAEAMSINVPGITSKKQITASGITVPYSTVSLMDNGELMGTATSKADGSWMVSAELLNEKYMLEHQIHALVENNGIVFRSESKTCVYDPNAVTVSKVTMINTAHTAANLNLHEYVTTFDFLNPQQPETYWYWPSYPDFTFKIDFTKNDPCLIHTVNIVVHTYANDDVTIPALFSQKDSCWIASRKFDSSSLPKNVSVLYHIYGLDLSDDAVYDAAFADEIGDFTMQIDSIAPDTYRNTFYAEDGDTICVSTDRIMSDEKMRQMKDSLLNVGYSLELDEEDGKILYNDQENSAAYMTSANVDNEIHWLVVVAKVRYLRDEHGDIIDDGEGHKYKLYKITKTIGKQWSEFLDSKILCSENGDGVELKFYKDYKEHITKYIYKLYSWKASELVCMVLKSQIEGDYKQKFHNRKSEWVEIPYASVYKPYVLTKMKRIKSIITKEQIEIKDTLRIVVSKTDKCPKPDNPNNDGFTGGDAAFVQDPSGYVYEAVSSNRLEGVTATVFQKTEVEDMYGDKHDVITKWDAEPYSQKNPVQTDANGLYAWDVPEGLWQVKFEKEGYETVMTDWLPVPPPQLDINIPMYHGVAPEVEKARGFESGVTLTFSKYMRPESFADGTVSVTRNGVAEKGSVTMIDAEKEPAGDKSFARKVKFVPDASFGTTDNVAVTVKKEVESYCGMPMTKDTSIVVPIESEIRAIECDSVVTVPYQGNAAVTVTVVPADAASGKTLKAETSSSMILSLAQAEAVIGKDGKAMFTVSGELPGAAGLTFTMAETDVAGLSKVEVVIPVTQVAAPTASIKTGSTVQKGTLLELATETENATIYYTLNGSCPCDENARHLYIEPIVISEDMEISVIAVKDGLDDSEIMTFRYTISIPEGVEDLVVGNDIHIKYSDGNLGISNAIGAVCCIYDTAGQLLVQTEIRNALQTISVPRTSVMLVQLAMPDGQRHSVKVTQ